MRVTLVCHKYGVSIDDPCCYPMGFMYISAVLKAAGHTVKVLNYNLHDYHLTDEIQEQDAILFTGFDEFLPHIIRDAAICRAAGVHTAIGGALATFKPTKMLAHCDCVVVGEGENVVEQALIHHGVLYGTRPHLPDLPLPDYEGFGIQEYHSRHAIRYMGVLASRGCPHNCTFCAHTCEYQCRPLADVFAEISHYQHVYQITHLIFNDNTLNVNKPRFMSICEGMMSRGLNWSAAIRVDVFDDEMAVAFQQSGGQYFVVGVESFNNDKLAAMNKHVTTSQITSTLDTLHRHNIGYHGNVLLGFPGESFDDIQAELATIPDKYNLFPVLVQPFVGTTIRGRSVTTDQAATLNGWFTRYAQNKGMSCYPMA